MDLKKIDAPLSTTTYNRNEVDAPTENIYEAISIISKRAEQINSEIKKELIEKLEEFATFNDSFFISELICSALLEIIEIAS